MLRKNVLFFFLVLFEYVILMSPSSGFSAADIRYRLDVYHVKCIGDARSLFVKLSHTFLFWRQKRKDQILGGTLQGSTIVVAGTDLIGAHFLTVFLRFEWNICCI
jgi:hypothetical protein